MQLSTGYDFLKGVIDVALGVFQEPQISLCSYSGVYFLCKETEGLKRIIEHRELYPEVSQAEITDSTLRNIKCSGDRSGFFIYCSSSKFIPQFK